MAAFALLLVWLASGGCAAMGPTEPYPSIDLPSHQPLAGTPGGSPVGLGEETLTLQRAIQLALAGNPEIAALEGDAAAAQARGAQASSQRLPRVSAVGRYARHLDEQRLLPVGEPGEPTTLSRDLLSADLMVSVPLFTGGRLANQVQAAGLLQQAATRRLAHSRAELVFDVTRLFYGILAQRHVVESLEFSRRALEAHVARTDALIAARKAAEVDRLRTQVRLADVEQQLVRERSLATLQRRVLAQRMGQEGRIDSLVLQGELELQGPPSVPDLEAGCARALAARADYLAARYALEAQARGVDAARAGHWPTVSLQASYGGRWAAGPTTGSGDSFGDLGRIGLAAEVPLFDGGAVRARVHEQRAQLAAARQHLRRLELQIRLEVETAAADVRSSQERVEALRTTIAQARESLRIEAQKYELGKGAVVDVLDAQAALLATETTYYRAQADLRTALAQLQLATGEG